MDGGRPTLEKDPGPARGIAGVGGGARAPLVVHVIDRLTMGGMENGLVNILNRAAPERYRHAIVCLREASDFRRRITRDDVDIHELHKRPGKDPGTYFRLWRLLRRLSPDIVHTRNLPTIDLAVAAALAGVSVRVHGEHGRDVLEVTGGNLKYNLLRRAVAPLVHRHIAVSRDLEGWLTGTVGVRPDKVTQIYNGVDCAKFSPSARGRADLPAPGFADPKSVVFGTVGRMETVKDQLTLVRAFIRLHDAMGESGARLRLVLVGDGALRAPAATLLGTAGLSHLAWMPGARDDVPALMRALDVFVLPSVAEGISNTILEAMASGLPVVATAVGGNPELIVDGKTGVLVPSGDPGAMAVALRAYAEDGSRISRHGAAARARAQNTFDLDGMVERYLSVYDDLLAVGDRR